MPILVLALVIAAVAGPATKEHDNGGATQAVKKYSKQSVFIIPRNSNNEVIKWLLQDLVLVL